MQNRAMAPATIDEYLAGVEDDKRAALERLREQIRAVIPDATEVISYGMPTFKLEGKWIVAFSASKQYCSLYTGRAPLLPHADELDEYRLWKGTINFLPNRPLPPELVATLVEEAKEARRS
jgi:uncharacterized protein YdhG (YjbR/CyaY superfamily)